MEDSNRKIIKVSKKKVLITFIVLIVIALLTAVFFIKVMTRTSGLNGETMVNVPSMPSLNFEENDIRKDYYNPQPTIKDTREFLKTSYSAEIKTRNVPDVMKDVKNAIRDAEGRVDSINNSEKNGYVSFVVPKSNFENFKNEIESLVHEKLYIENTSSQNLLSQKQGIEQQAGSILKSLTDLEKDKKELDSKHTSILNSIKKELSTVQAQLATIKQEITKTTDNAQLTTLRNQEYLFMQKENTLKQNQNTENSNYTIQSKNIKSQMDQVNNDLSNNIKQDTQFTDNIETVNGTIRVNWVSLWAMAKIFSPIHPTLIIIILVIAAWFSLRHKKYIPKVEFI